MNKVFPFSSSKYFYEVKFVASEEQLATELGESVRAGILAFCRYDFDSTGNCVGQLVFWNKSLKTIVHECVHAAMAFYNHKIHASEEVQAMTEEDQVNYYEEALAVLTENLFGQVIGLVEEHLADCS